MERIVKESDLVCDRLMDRFGDMLGLVREGGGVVGPPEGEGAERREGDVGRAMTAQLGADGAHDKRDSVGHLASAPVRRGGHDFPL
jgi:hypothetical protein